MAIFEGIDHESGRNVHGRQFLKQEFASIRQVDLRDLGLVSANAALERRLFQVGNCHEAAEITNVDTISIRCIKQALLIG